jgi:hypothetical protein
MPQPPLICVLYYNIILYYKLYSVTLCCNYLTMNYGAIIEIVMFRCNQIEA